MSPKKSPGQLAGQALDPDGRDVVGRAVDIEWSPWRPHFTRVVDAPDAVLGRLPEDARRRVADEQWVAWTPCWDDLCECWRPPGTEGLLDKFLALEDATPSDIEKFVFDQGPIAGCVHVRPHDSCGEVISTQTIDGSPTTQTLAVVFWEAPVVYREYARLFRTVLTLAADLQAGEDGNLELWTGLVGSLPGDARDGLRDTWELAYGVLPPPDDPGEFCERVLSAGLAPDLLASVVYLLMSESSVVVGFQWPLFGDGVFEPGRTVYPREAFADRPSLRLVGDTFGVLSYQLAAAIQGSLFAICSNCQQTYAPKRRPQSGRDNYCPACRDARKTAYKRRRREASGNGSD